MSDRVPHQPPIYDPGKSERLYAKRSPVDLLQFYANHISAMTAEGLHSKADIAAELAHRDARIAELEALLSGVHCGCVCATASWLNGGPCFQCQIEAALSPKEATRG